MTKPKRVRVRSEAERTRHNIKQNAARLKARGGVEIVSLRSILMSLIAEKAATETGFASLDAGDNFKYAADICGELVKSGALFKAQIKRRVFYFTTPEAANARVAKQTATPKPRKQRKYTPQGQHARQRIAALSLRAQGVQLHDLEPGEDRVFENAVAKWVASGELIRVKLQGERLRYFANQALADNFVSTYFKPAPKPRKQHKLTPLVTHPQHALVMQTKPSPGLPKIKQPVEIIYPERYLKISRPWVDPRAVIVPMRRIGQPDFSMSI